MQTGQVFYVHILPRDRARRDRESASLPHGDAPDIRAPLGASRDDRFGHVPSAKATNHARPFALGARKAKLVHETHLAALASGRRNDHGHDTRNAQMLWRRRSHTRGVEPMRLGEITCRAVPLGPASGASLDG